MASAFIEYASSDFSALSPAVVSSTNNRLIQISDDYWLLCTSHNSQTMAMVVYSPSPDVLQLGAPLYPTSTGSAALTQVFCAIPGTSKVIAGRPVAITTTLLRLYYHVYTQTGMTVTASAEHSMDLVIPSGGVGDQMVRLVALDEERIIATVTPRSDVFTTLPFWRSWLLQPDGSFVDEGGANLPTYPGDEVLPIVASQVTNGSINGSSISGFTTASVTPATSSLQLLSFSVLNVSSTQPTVTSVVGCGLTWTLVRKVDFDSSGANRGTLFVYRALGTPTTGTVTVTFGQTDWSTAWTWQEFAEVAPTSTVRQSASGSGTSTTPLATLAGFGAPFNASFAAVSSYVAGAGTFTAGAGFTELDETNSDACNVATEFNSTNDGDTSVDGTLTSSAIWGMIALEIAAPSGGPSYDSIRFLKRVDNERFLTVHFGVASRAFVRAMCIRDGAPGPSVGAGGIASASVPATSLTVTYGNPFGFYALSGDSDTWFPGLTQFDGGLTWDAGREEFWLAESSSASGSDPNTFRMEKVGLDVLDLSSLDLYVRNSPATFNLLMSGDGERLLNASGNDIALDRDTSIDSEFDGTVAGPTFSDQLPIHDRKLLLFYTDIMRIVGMPSPPTPLAPAASSKEPASAAREFVVHIVTRGGT